MNGDAPGGAARVFHALEVPFLAAVPLTLVICAVFAVDATAVLSLAVVIGAVAVFFAGFETGRPSLRTIMPTVVLAALAVAGRTFIPIPDFKPVSAICILAGVTFGKRSGFLVGSLAALVSSLFLGIGPWTPWQMYAWGLIGYLAGVFADRGWMERSSTILVFGFVSGLLYGALLNAWFVIGFVDPITWESIGAAFLAGLPYDLIHCVATTLFLAVFYVPWRRKLERIKRRYELV